MRVLVACEFSGVVRDAFLARGHDALSCDLLPSESTHTHTHHIQKDVLSILGDSWDLMIAHPPCTHLCSSGARWFKGKLREQSEALDFVQKLLDAPIPRIALENPIGVISSRIRKPDQTIQPYQFGHPERKSTCLWLKNLPKLHPTDVVVPEWAIKADGSIHVSATGKHDSQTHFMTGRIRVLSGLQKEQWERIHRLPPSPDRWKIRSRTYQGIAKAMAEQWGCLA